MKSTMQQTHKKLQKNLLVASISTLMVTGLTACGGGGDYKAQDCNGSQTVGCGAGDQPNTPNIPNNPKPADPASPVANDDAITTAYNTAITIDVTANDTDINNDLDISTLKLVDPSNNQLVNKVTVTNKGVWKVEAGKINFTPDVALEGDTLSIDYSIDDKDATTTASTATIKVTVGEQGNQKPIAEDNRAETTDDKAISGNVITDITAGKKDTDPDDDTLTIANFSINNASYLAGKTANISSDDKDAGTLIINEDGSYTYTPKLGFAGDVAIQYTLTDGKLTDTANLTISVTSTVVAFDWSDISRDTSTIQSMSKVNSSVWTASSEDETAKDLTINGNTAVVATYWHNKAHSFTLTDNIATLQADFDFATTSGSRHDVVSGASEQLLDGMVGSEDGKLIVGAVSKAGENTTGDKGVGLYVSQADSSGTFAPVSHASSDSKGHYPYKDISAYAINNSDKSIAIASKSGAIKLLSTNLEQTIAEANVDFQISALAFSADGKRLFVSGKKKLGLFSSEGVVAMLNIDDMSETWRWKTADSLVQLVSLGDTRVLARPSTGKEMYVVGNDDGSNTVKNKTIAIAGSPTDIAVSSDKQLVAVSQLNQVEVINLANNKRAVNITNAKVAGIGFSGQDTAQYLWTATNDSKLTSYSLPVGMLD